MLYEKPLYPHFQDCSSYVIFPQKKMFLTNMSGFNEFYVQQYSKILYISVSL